jgi:hypothetical protein
METPHGMLAQMAHEDRARAYAHPGRRHAAEARIAREGGASRVRSLHAAVVARLVPVRDLLQRSEPAGVRCIAPDGREGRLVARAEGGRRVFVCEVS